VKVANLCLPLWRLEPGIAPFGRLRSCHSRRSGDSLKSDPMTPYLYGWRRRASSGSNRAGFERKFLRITDWYSLQIAKLYKVGEIVYD